MTPNRPGCLASTSTDTVISVETDPSGWQVALTKALVSPRRNKADEPVVLAGAEGRLSGRPLVGAVEVLAVRIAEMDAERLNDRAGAVIEQELPSMCGGPNVTSLAGKPTATPTAWSRSTDQPTSSRSFSASETSSTICSSGSLSVSGWPFDFCQAWAALSTAASSSPR